MGQNVVVFDAGIKNAVIKHAFLNPTKEVGGFLYGIVEMNKDSKIVYVNGIYFDKNKIGGDYNFKFDLSYLLQGVEMTEYLNMSLIGCYHTHGIYPAIQSFEDRYYLHSHFGDNSISVIYSAGHSQLVCELLSIEEGVKNFQRCKILTK